jgi:hypothetical protein
VLTAINGGSELLIFVPPTAPVRSSYLVAVLPLQWPVVAPRWGLHVAVGAASWLAYRSMIEADLNHGPDSSPVEGLME